MLILGVKGDNGSSPPSTRLQACTSAPASVQKANLLGDANGGSAAARHPRSKRAHPGDELPHPSPPCFFCTASTGPATELFWVEAASFGKPSERSPCSFCTTHWPEEITPGKGFNSQHPRAPGNSSLLLWCHLIEHSFLPSHLHWG